FVRPAVKWNGKKLKTVPSSWAEGCPGPLDTAQADNGSNFRIDPTACQYIYNLAASVFLGHRDVPGPTSASTEASSVTRSLRSNETKAVAKKAAEPRQKS